MADPVINFFEPLPALETANKSCRKYAGALADLSAVKMRVNGREVIGLRPISNECLETYPCKGHRGIVISTDDGHEFCRYCCSQSIGAIFKYYEQCDNGHFTKYVSDLEVGAISDSPSTRLLGHHSTPCPE